MTTNFVPSGTLITGLTADEQTAFVTAVLAPPSESDRLHQAAKNYRAETTDSPGEEKQDQTGE